MNNIKQYIAFQQSRYENAIEMLRLGNKTASQYLRSRAMTCLNRVRNTLSKLWDLRDKMAKTKAMLKAMSQANVSKVRYNKIKLDNIRKLASELAKIKYVSDALDATNKQPVVMGV